jgi:ABC-type hemin transport system substrate-binding protein
MAWAMLIDQLGRTIRAVGDAHGVRGETEMAKELVDTLSAEIAALHKQFEASSTDERVPGERAHEVRSPGAMGKNLQHQAKHHRGRGQGPERSIER